MPSKRHRACEACHSAKVRCELALQPLSHSGIHRPCRRCRKLQRECFPAVPRLQRNRIAELEAQVQALSETKVECAAQWPEPISANVEASVCEGRDNEQARAVVESDAHTPVYPLTQFATNVGIDIGIGGLPHSLIHNPDIAYLQRYAATSATATVIRDVDLNPWTPFHDECLNRIRDSPNATTTDLQFCRLITAERLCHLIASRTGVCGQSVSATLHQDSTQRESLKLRSEIEKWSKTSFHQQPILTFYRHIAVVYLNESILHTPSNKWTFSAPFVPERIAPGDFAAPPVTVDLIGSLYAIRDSCHAALDTALSLDLSADLSLMPVSFHPRVLYAIFILVKLYLAVTAPGNTYATVLSKSELRLEEYFDKLRSPDSSLLGGHVGLASYSGMILTATAWLEHWFVGYKAIAEEYERRVNLELIWTPAISSSAEKFGLHMEETNHAILPRDLVPVHDSDGEPRVIATSPAKTSRAKQRQWKQHVMEMPRMELSVGSVLGRF